jgi:hypothetical protein
MIKIKKEDDEGVAKDGANLWLGGLTKNYALI